MDNFTAIRNGIREHVSAGKLSPFDLGIYTFLHLWADWKTGIYQGCALSIAYSFGDPSQKGHIQQSLRRLRDRRYINYPRGDGSRGGYSILIHKYEPTVGELLGTRLNAWKNGVLVQPDYELQNGGDTVATRSRNGDATVMTPIQDIKTLDIKTQHEEQIAPSIATPDFRMMWNDHCGGLPKVREMTNGRTHKLKARQCKPTFEQDFTAAVKKAAGTPFLLGENNRGWKANFDWLIANDTNCVAILEGKYDGKPTGNRAKSGAFFSTDDPARYEREADFTLRVG